MLLFVVGDKISYSFMMLFAFLTGLINLQSRNGMTLPGRRDPGEFFQQSDPVLHDCSISAIGPMFFYNQMQIEELLYHYRSRQIQIPNIDPSLCSVQSKYVLQVLHEA